MAYSYQQTAGQECQKVFCVKLRVGVAGAQNNKAMFLVMLGAGDRVSEAVLNCQWMEPHRLEQELFLGIAGLHYVEPAALHPLKLGRQIIKCELLFASLAASGCQEPDTGHAGATCFTVKPLSPRLVHCRRCETAVRALHRRAVALSGTVSQTQLFHYHSRSHCSAAAVAEYRVEV